MRAKPGALVLAFALLISACSAPETPPTSASSRPARPIAGKQLYLGTSSGAALVPIHPLTLADLSGPPLLAVADSSSSSFVVSADGATGAAMAYLYRDPPSPSDLRVLVFDLRTGAERASPSPPRAVIVDALSPDGTKLFARDWPSAQISAARLVLDSATGRVLETLPAFSLNGLTTWRIDYATLRLYGLTVADDSGKASAPQPATFVAVDLRTGRELRRLPLEGLVAGLWESEAGGTHRQSELYPGFALSPDGTRLAILRADGDWLTLIYTGSLGVIWTKRLSRPVSLLERLGLGPLVAEAKTNYESRSWGLTFTPDGKRLFAVEQTVQLEGETTARYATPRLRSIDIERAAIESEIVPPDRVLWTTASPDAGGLYVLIQGKETAPKDRYRLVRLEAATLAVTAQRALDDYREMRVLVPPQATSAPSGTCEPTARRALGNATALVGGNLAYGGLAEWRAAFDEKAPWFWRTNDRTQRLMLRAARIDAGSSVVTKDLGPPQEVHDGFVRPAEWGGNLVYGGYVGLGGLRLPEPGCWRVSIVGGRPDDAVVLGAIAAPAGP